MVRSVVGSILHGGPIELFLVPASALSGYFLFQSIPSSQFCQSLGPLHTSYSYIEGYKLPYVEGYNLFICLWIQVTHMLQDTIYSYVYGYKLPNVEGYNLLICLWIQVTHMLKDLIYPYVKDTIYPFDE